MAARIRVATRSGTVADGLATIQAARNNMPVTLQPLSAVREENMLHHSTPYATNEAHNLVCQLDRSCRVLRASPHKMQALVTTLLCEHQQRDCLSFAVRVEPPWVQLAVMCNGLCTSSRFHFETDDYDRFCRLDALISLIVCAITTSAAWRRSSPISGGMQTWWCVLTQSCTTC